MGLSNVFLVLPLLYILVKPVISLIHNYKKARDSGLKIIISPITPYTWQWQFATAAFDSFLQSFRWYRAINWNCAWKDGDSLHRELGANFLVVSPGLNVLCTSDPKTMEHTFRKWREFVKPDNVNEILGTFGQNVDTSNGDDWVRHRKLTAPCFSERASSTVWRQAIQQSNTLLSKWISMPDKETSGVVRDTSTLTLNVISAIAFENHQVNKPSDGHTISLRQSLITVMGTSISPSMDVIMPWLRAFGIQVLLPKKVKELLNAMHEFSQYMDEIVARERSKSPEDEIEAKSNLITTLLKANNAARTGQSETSGRLSDVEVRGNIFIFTVGGLESTASTLAYALSMLAMNPGIQEWVADEVREVFEEEDKEYSKVFPRMNRIMAVMYETLRIYAPSPPLPRSHVNPRTPFTIPITSNKPKSDNEPASITLPGDTQLMHNSWACHTSPIYFSEPKTWNPKRWISSEGKLLHPTSESGFYAWGLGPRICPGMKFSQVEFTAVLANIVKKVKVGLVVDKNEGEALWEKEKGRIMDVLGDSCADPLLLHIRKPEGLRLRITVR